MDGLQRAILRAHCARNTCVITREPKHPEAVESAPGQAAPVPIVPDPARETHVVENPDIPPEPPRPVYPTIAAIIAAVCQHYEIGRLDLVSARRTANIVLPRQVAIYLARTLTVHSLPAIGRQFDGRDHTTVLHSIRKIERLRASKPKFDAELTKLAEQIVGFDPRADFERSITEGFRAIRERVANGGPGWEPK